VSPWASVENVRTFLRELDQTHGAGASVEAKRSVGRNIETRWSVDTVVVQPAGRA